MFYRFGALLVIIFAIFTTVTAQDTSLTEAVNRYVQETLSDQGIPGLALAVIRDGEVVLARGYGLADVEGAVPVTESTLFETASIAKPIFAVALMQLVEDGLVELNVPVSTYIRDAPETWGKVTLRQILTHTSGLPYSIDMPAAYTYDDVLQAAQTIELNAMPGQRWEYSDFGYQLIAVVIERVSGQSSADYVRKNVFERAGMPTAQISSTVPVNTATGYRQTREGIAQSAENTPDQPLVPGSGVYLSLQDYIAWDAALANNTLLTQASRDEMWTSGVLNDGSLVSYGLGWTVREVDNRLVVEHGGGSLNVVNRFVRYVDAGLSIVMLSNLAFSRATDIAYEVAVLYDPALFTTADSEIVDAVNDPFPEVTALLRTIFEGMIDGTLDRTLFTPEAQANFYDELIAAGSDLQAVGAPTHYRLLEFSEEDGMRTYRYEVNITVTAFVTLTLDDDNKIASFEISI